jgi:hypothetical protein
MSSLWKGTMVSRPGTYPKRRNLRYIASRWLSSCLSKILCIFIATRVTYICTWDGEQVEDIRSNKRGFVRVNFCHLGIHIAVFPSTSSSIEARVTTDIANFSCCHLLAPSRLSRNAKQKMLCVDNSSKQKGKNR